MEWVLMLVLVLLVKSIVPFTTFPASRTSITEFLAQTGPEASPASANTAPSLWLYKFPPWFFPSNPPPKEFLPKHLQVSESVASGPVETTVFQTKTSGVVHRHARLTRVKVPINSAFRDQVIRMILDVKRDAGQAFFSTPLLVPQGVWQPTLPPSLRDHLTTSQPEDKGHYIVSLGLPFTSTSGEILSGNNNGESKPTITNVQDFQSSPLDLTQARSSNSRGNFRPSKLLSVITSDQDSKFSIRGGHQNINSTFSTVLTSVSQDVSDVSKQNLHQTTLAHIALEYPYAHTSLITLPNVTSHFLVNKNIGKSLEELERDQKSSTWEGFRPFLKNDQDIRNTRKKSDYVHSLDHDHQPSFASHPDDVKLSGQGKEKWFWPIP